MPSHNSFSSVAVAAKTLSTTVTMNRHSDNVVRMNAKNAHAVALGKMSSPAKAAAAEENGKKGGRPAGS